MAAPGSSTRNATAGPRDAGASRVSTLGALTEAVEGAQWPHALDHAAERHELRQHVQDEQHHEDTRPRRLPEAEHDAEAEHAADDVGAGVAEHESFPEVVGQEGEGGAHDGSDRDPDGVGAERY